jgi:IS30 family transposase
MANTTKTNRTTEADKEEIVRLRKAGMSKRAIVDKLGKSIGTVSHWCLVLGIDSPQPKTAKGAAKPFMRNGREVRQFNPEEDRQLLDWAREGISKAEIAKRLGRSASSVSYRLLTLARRDRLSERGSRR